MKNITLSKNDMINYTVYISKETTNGDIFKLFREIQDVTAKNGARISNIGELYFFIKGHRDDILSIKDSPKKSRKMKK